MEKRRINYTDRECTSSYISFKGKMFIVKILLYISYLLRRLAGQKKPHGLVYHFDQATCYYETKIVKLKNLEWTCKNITLEQVKNLYEEQDVLYPEWFKDTYFYKYDWKSLIEDLKKNKLKTNLSVFKYKHQKGYFIYDGNHRAIALEYLYGDEHEVPVDIYMTNDFYNNHRIRLMNNAMCTKYYIKERLDTIKNKTYGE